MRPDKRNADQLRDIRITPDYLPHAAGSALIEYGDTRVLCAVSISSGVPVFLRGSGKGWLTAEYGMLPMATEQRNRRETATGRSGRTYEIQRLISRSLRAAVDLNLLAENTVQVDCDVIRADGGTRTAAITGSCVALADALRRGHKNKRFADYPLTSLVAAVSVGIVRSEAVLDLNYAEDSNADTDMNIVMNDEGQFIEVQGTAEKHAFHENDLQQMLALAKAGIQSLLQHQKEVINRDDG